MGVNIVAVQKIISSMYWGRISDRILPWKSFLGMLLVWPRQFNDGHPNVIGFYSDRLMKIISSLTSYNSVFNTCVRCLPSVYFLYILNKAETWICSSPEERLFAMDWDFVAQVVLGPELACPPGGFWLKHRVTSSDISGFRKADVNAYFSQHIKIDLIQLSSGSKC